MATAPTTAVRDVHVSLSRNETVTIMRRLSRETKLVCVTAAQEDRPLTENEKAHAKTYRRIARRLNDALEAAGYERYEVRT